MKGSDPLTRQEMIKYLISVTKDEKQVLRVSSQIKDDKRLKAMCLAISKS